MQTQANDVEPSLKRRREEPLLANAAPHGTVTFDGQDVTFSQHIRRPAAGRDLQIYTYTASVCVSGLVQCEGMQIQQCHSAHRQDVITVVVPLPIVLKLPVLKELRDVTVPETDSEKVSPGNVATEGSLRCERGRTAPFTPPVSIWALVSLFLVLEDKIDLWSLFGDVNTDARLASHTILVCPALPRPSNTRCASQFYSTGPVGPIGLKGMKEWAVIVGRDRISGRGDRSAAREHPSSTGICPPRESAFST